MNKWLRRTWAKQCHPEAVAILRGKIGSKAIHELMKAKPNRQLEIAKLMELSDNYSYEYTVALIKSSCPDELY